MRKSSIISLALVVLLCSLSSGAEAGMFWRRALTGGAADALDAISSIDAVQGDAEITALATGDGAIVVTATYTYHYLYDDASTAAAASPDVIAPFDAGATGRWILSKHYITEADVTAHQAALSITEAQISNLSHYGSADFAADLASKTTDNLVEGGNLYYADARVAAAPAVAANTAHSQSTHAPADAEQNVQADWDELVIGSDAYILNKPVIPSLLSQLANDVGFLTAYTETDPTAEPALGNPAADGYVLSSTAAGVRSWVAAGSGDMAAYDADADNKVDKAEGLEADASANIVIKMGDAGGVNKISFVNSLGVEVGSMDSDGVFTASSYGSSAPNGDHFLDVINTVAITASPTLGRVSYYNNYLRFADGVDWDTYFLMSSDVGTIVQPYDADLAVNTVEFVFADLTATSTGQYVRIPTASTWTTAYILCDAAETTTPVVFDLWMKSTISGSATELTSATSELTMSTTNAYVDAIDISGFTDPAAGAWVRLDIATIADTATECTVALTLTE